MKIKLFRWRRQRIFFSKYGTESIGSHMENINLKPHMEDLILNGLKS
jgi:hypothetical protein